MIKERWGGVMVEVWAAVCGASITVAKPELRYQPPDHRAILIRLTTAVDNLSSRLDILHQDIRSKDVEVKGAKN